MTRYFVSKGVPVGISESENADYRRFECLYYQGRVKLTEGTDYTYVVEGNDAPRHGSRGAHRHGRLPWHRREGVRGEVEQIGRAHV